MEINTRKATNPQISGIRCSHIEIEAKWHLDGEKDLKRIRKLLRQMGSELVGKRHETNRILDNEQNKIRQNKKALRLRLIDNDKRAVLTLKSPIQRTNNAKLRSELEVEVNDGHTMGKILEELGYLPFVEYPKIRETWRLIKAEVLLDQLPFGYFCEIEGPLNEIQVIGKNLGLNLEKCETRDYATLQQKYLGKKG